MKRKDIRGRIRKLEQENHTDTLEPSRIEVLSNDEVEIYTIKHGREVIMTDEEYHQWLSRKHQMDDIEPIEIDVGE